MNKKSIHDVSLDGKRVLMRVDFNVPLDGTVVTDDTRIRAALPTIQLVLEQGASLVLMSHCGRPKGKVVDELSLRPAAECLTKLLGKTVGLAPDCVGAETLALVEGLEVGDVLLLENLRFHPEEEGKVKFAEGASVEEQETARQAAQEKQREFARQLSELGDVYVNDAFGTAHRAHASMAVVTDFFDECVAGLLLEKEIEYLGSVIDDPKRPFVAIIGGAKISGKIDVIQNLVEKVDTLIVGGGMVYTFYRHMGLKTGDSIVEEDKIAVAGETLKRIEEKGLKFLLPVDHIVADKFGEDANTQIVAREEIPDGWESLDIGPKSAALFADAIKDAQTIVWNGPMGCFEMAPFAAGTKAVMTAVAENEGVSIVGGGDSVAAVNANGLADRISHISTGGGASLEFLEGKALPGVEALSDK